MALRSRLRAVCTPRERLLAVGLALAAGIVVFIVASELFPYHSNNHDEGVYLQQAELLLDGQFQLSAGEFGSAVRPWFFVDAGDQFYPKYQPLPAAFYAVAMALFDEPRVTLAVVAAGNTALVYILGSMAFDRRIGLVGAAGFALSPLTLISSSVFLPYAPTTLFNLLFAVCYLRAVRSGRIRSALLAGLAIGIAFFMRPYTAVLFATPFLLHALWEIGSALREDPPDLTVGPPRFGLPDAILRQSATAIVGVVFVALAFAYNAYVTGSPLVFPYEAFAPMDGPGLGRRRILGYSIEYSADVALRANGYVLWYLLTRWVPAGALGTLLAVVGLLVAARERGWLPAVGARSVPGDQTARLLLAGLFVSVPVGNVFFWGNYNILQTATDPADGLLGQFGPFYHFDLLAPVAIFGAAGAVTLWRGRGRLTRHLPEGVTLPSRQQSRAIALATLLVAVLLVGGVNAALVSAPVERNAEHTETYEQAYAPFEDRTFDNALVFLPTPYGEWLNHPFQYLRNDPGFDGSAVYVMDRGTEDDFAMVDAAPDRTPYRYTYQGEWSPVAEEREAIPRLEALAVRENRAFDAETTVGVPDRVTHAIVRLETEDGYSSQTLRELGDQITVEWSLNSTHVSLDGAETDGPIAIEPVGEVVLKIRLVQSNAGTLTYRQETAVRQTDAGIEAIWPSERTVCTLVDDCGRQGVYLPDRPDQHIDGVSFETTLEATTGTENEDIP